MGGNVAGQYKRASAVALLIGISNLSGLVSSNIYRAKDAPRYRLGRESQSTKSPHILTTFTDGVELGILSVGLIVIPILVFSYNRINAQREAIMEGVGESGRLQYTDEELRRMGDKAPNFRYGI